MLLFYSFVAVISKEAKVPCMKLAIFNRIRLPNVKTRVKFFATDIFPSQCRFFGLCVGLYFHKSFVFFYHDVVKSFFTEIVHFDIRTNDFLLNQANQVKKITARETTNYGTWILPQYFVFVWVSFVRKVFISNNFFLNIFLSNWR